jgi:hypothetical protein
MSIKDIVQLKKRGSRGLPIIRPAFLVFYTIADIFFEHLKRYSHVLNLKNPVSAFMATVWWGFYDTVAYDL